jgi:hypothetical protein
MTARVIDDLNAYPVKENIKDVIGSLAFGAGIVALYKYSGIPLKKNGLSRERVIDEKLISILKWSVALSCIASRPGLLICGWVIHPLVSPKTLSNIFGLNTIFEFNPLHPRHIVTIAANVLSASALIKWVFDRYVPTHQPVNFLVAVGAYNFFSGRSTLHLVNAACRHFFRK